MSEQTRCGDLAHLYGIAKNPVSMHSQRGAKVDPDPRDVALVLQVQALSVDVLWQRAGWGHIIRVLPLLLLGCMRG